MCKVTVAMASYNHAAFVGEAIESVLAQQNCDFELIIVDDGSQDDTVKEIKKFNDPRLKWIGLQQNQGACVALRQAIEAGSGDYVAILNSDDAFLPGKLEKQVAFLDHHSSIHAVFGFAKFIDELSQPLQKHEHFYGDIFSQSNRSRFDWLHDFFYQTNTLCHPTLMIRRSCYEQLGYYDFRLAQIPDFDFWIRLILHADIHVMQEELIRFRILKHERNASAPSASNFRRAQWELLQVLPHFLKIPSLHDYLKIFPEDTYFMKDWTEADATFIIPYAVAQKALKVAKQTKPDFIPSIYKPSYGLFGLQTLYGLFAQPKFVEHIAPKLGINFGNFTQLAKQLEIFYLDNQPFRFRAVKLMKEALEKIKQKIRL